MCAVNLPLLPVEAAPCDVGLPAVESCSIPTTAVGSVGESLVKVPCLTRGGGPCNVSDSVVAVGLTLTCSRLLGLVVALCVCALTTVAVLALVGTLGARRLDLSLSTLPGELGAVRTNR